MKEEHSTRNKHKIQYYRVQANVNIQAIRHNIQEIRKSINPNTKLMLIIKADGYGHGAVPIANETGNLADSYGVAIVEEAMQLREAGITKPILVLGYTPKEQYESVVEHNIIQTVFQYEMARDLNEEAKKQGKTVKVHIKLDTGMSRIGFPDKAESVTEIKRIFELEYVEVEGIFSHFSCADELDKSFSHQQLKRYLNFIDLLEKENMNIPIKHIANSAGIIDLPEANLDLVRCGIATYGIYPSEEVKKDRIQLTPAMELKTRVIYVKEVEKNVGISYGATFITKKKTRIATIPVGYADGYSRLLSNTGRVIIHGTYAPIIGRVCMDQFMIDVSEIEGVKEGDIVTLLGTDGDAKIPVEELAELSQSFPYELVCNVGKRIPRVYVDIEFNDK